MTEEQKKQFLRNQLNVLYPSQREIFRLVIANMKKLPSPQKAGVELLMKHEFDVEGFLGSGAFGQVYLVRRKSDYSYLAVKLSLIVGSTTKKVACTELEMNEVRKKGKIRCMLPYLEGTSSLMAAENAHLLDNIQFVMPIGLSYTQYMEYILNLKNNVLSRREILSLMYHLFSNLAFLHKESGQKEAILHRDIKLDNMLLIPSQDGGIELVFSDFGTSRVISATDFITGCGTPMFMPIAIRNVTTELARLTPDVAKKFDVYSVAITCYIILDGLQPLKNNGGIKRQHLATAPTKISKPDYCRDDDVWEILKEIICHSADLEKIPSAEEVCEKIEKLLFKF